MYHHRGTSLKLSVYVSSCVARCRMSLFLMSYYFWLDYIDMFKLAQPHFRWIRCLHSTHAVFLTLGKPLSYASLNIVIGWAVMIGCWASCSVSDWPIMNVSILHRHAWACLRLKYHAPVDIYEGLCNRRLVLHCQLYSTYSERRRLSWCSFYSLKDFFILF